MTQAHHTVLCSLNAFQGSSYVDAIARHGERQSGIRACLLLCAIQDLVADGLLWQEGNVVGLTELGEKEVA